MFKEISYSEAKDFLLPRHYSGRIPSISYAFGYFSENKLLAVCTFGKPASNALCKGVCGEEYSDKVFELNRLCRVENINIQLSKFVAYCLKQLKPLDLIIISYSDTAMNHSGYIYQATNWIYTGKTKKRTDKYTEGNKHSRHYDKNVSDEIRKVRSSKHRYIYFACNRRLKKILLNCLNYNVEEYPKEENKNYTLGDFLKPELIYK